MTIFLLDTPGPVPAPACARWQRVAMASTGHLEAVDVHVPKLDGHRVALRGRVYPDTHRRAVIAARERGLSLSDYLASLIDADTGVRTPLPSTQEALDISA